MRPPCPGISLYSSTNSKCRNRTASFSRRGHAVLAFRKLNAPAVKPPAEMVDKLNNEINAGLADPKMKARLADLGGDLLALSPAEFGRLTADETEKWGKVIRAANIKVD